MVTLVDALSEADTIAAAQALAATLSRPTVIALHGDLGAGKSVFARGFITYFLPTARVPSPTFTLVQPYAVPGGLTVWHFDLYRLKRPDELIELGFDDALSGLVLIEWPDKGGAFIPTARLKVTLTPGGGDRRRIVIKDLR
jgi:tRNA threonylcarbamoyladenosine biosynthesis protein TsaE